MASAKRFREDSVEEDQRKRARVGETGERYLNTVPLLRDKINEVKQTRKEKRSQMTLNQNIEASRQHFLNDDLDPGVPPGTKEAKLRYGAREPLAPVMRRDQLEHENPRVLYDMPDMDIGQAEHLAELERETLGIGRISGHFMNPEYFKETSPKASAAVSLSMGTKSKRALQSDGTADAPGKTDSTILKKATEEYALASGRLTEHQKTVRASMERIAEESRERRRLNREKRKEQKSDAAPSSSKQHDKEEAGLKVPDKYRDDPALFGGKPEDNAEFAIMNWRGFYQMAQSDIDQFKDLSRKKIKPRQPPDDFMIPTDAPPAGNANVVAARRTFLRHREAFENEGNDAVDNAKQDILSTSKVPLPSEPTHGPEAPAMLAVERRTIKVVDPVVYDNPRDDIQQGFKLKGDRFAAEMAKQHERPPKVPVAIIDHPADRARELGHDPTYPGLADLMETDELRGLPTESLNEEESAVLPLARYPGRFREKASRIAELGMAEQLIFDQSGYLGNLTPKVQRWKTEQNGELLTRPREKGGMKILTKEANDAARNVKKQREVIGIQAQFDPPRRRTRFDHNKTRYCLDMLRQNDIFFANDRIKFARGRAMAHPFDTDAMQIDTDGPQRKSTVILPDRAEPTGSEKFTQALLESSRGGLLGSLTDRILRENAETPMDRVGSDYFASSYELGTGRLHPDCNPEIPVVKRAYLERYFEQARPDLRKYERECVRGENCVCYSRNSKLADNSSYFEARNAMNFIAKEGLLPHEETAARTLGKLPTRRKSCFLCYMEEVTRNVASLQFDGISPSRPLNEFRVAVGSPGEFRAEDCLPVSYTFAGKSTLTGIIGHFPKYNEIFFRHSVRAEGNIDIRYISYSPSVTGFC